MLLLKDTLTKHLSCKKEDGKVKLKWNGTLIDFRDFVSLILEFKGNWEFKHQDNYEIHSFKDPKSKFKIIWWPSSKTFIIQGRESSKVIKMVENVLNLPEESENELVGEASIKSTPKSKKRSRNKSKSRLNVNSQVSHESEFRKIWEAIECLKPRSNGLDFSQCNMQHLSSGKSRDRLTTLLILVETCRRMLHVVE